MNAIVAKKLLVGLAIAGVATIAPYSLHISSEDGALAATVSTNTCVGLTCCSQEQAVCTAADPDLFGWYDKGDGRCPLE